MSRTKKPRKHRRRAQGGDIAAFRAKWRDDLGNGVLKPKEYKRRVAVHEDTLDKYLGQFGRWLGVWLARDGEKRRLAESVFGMDRLEDILSGGSPRLSEVFKLHETHDFSGDFSKYFLGKTHLSFELGKAKPEPRRPQKNNYSGPYHSKLGEFVFIILSEAIVLHNYQFVGRIRGRRVNTIDKWMRGKR